MRGSVTVRTASAAHAGRGEFGLQQWQFHGSALPREFPHFHNLARQHRRLAEEERLPGFAVAGSKRLVLVRRDLLGPRRVQEDTVHLGLGGVAIGLQPCSQPRPRAAEARQLSDRDRHALSFFRNRRAQLQRLAIDRRDRDQFALLQFAEVEQLPHAELCRLLCVRHLHGLAARQHRLAERSRPFSGPRDGDHPRKHEVRRLVLRGNGNPLTAVVELPTQ